jgi:hypothetical protein
VPLNHPLPRRLVGTGKAARLISTALGRWAAVTVRLPDEPWPFLALPAVCFSRIGRSARI